MPTLNPDFRNVDEVEIPDEYDGGWTEGGRSEADAIYLERQAGEALDKDMPRTTVERFMDQPVNPVVRKKWDDFQASKGRGPGSNDLSMLDEFVLQRDLEWKPQIIGSCVCSNTFRAYTIRLMWEIALLGSSESHLGTDEYGPNNIAPYGPYSYGMARRRANMRGGDGLYCAPMAESLMKDGVLLCSTPDLVTLCKRLGVDGQHDYPEPQSKRVYRDFGNWKYIDQLTPYAGFPVSESVQVTTAQQLWDLQISGKPTFVCSMEAIHKVGTHPDGFPIHARNPRNTWAHNMAVHGCFIAQSDGERFFRWSNRSWGPQHLYNRRYSEVDRALQTGRLTMRSIGNITGPEPMPNFL